MNSALGFMMIFFALSCSTLLWKEHPVNTRELSSFAEPDDSCHQKIHEKQKKSDFFYISTLDESHHVGIADESIQIINADNCVLKHHQLDFHDSVVFVANHLNKIFVRTMHGQLIFISNTEIEKKVIPFPVASFEIVGDEMNLYSAKNDGRFCDHYQLQLPREKRDKACLLISSKIQL